MNLRQKILWAIVGVMCVVSTMLMLAIIPDAAKERIRARQVASSAAARQLTLGLGAVPLGNRESFLAEHGWEFLDHDAIDAYAVLDGSRRLVWWSYPEPAFAVKGDLDLNRFDIVRELPGGPEGKPWILLVRSPPADVGALGGLSGAFSIMVLGTLILVVVVYGLLDRLVLRPVEQLADASRRLNVSPELAKVAELSRSDEIGDLIRSHNRMVDEVTDLRKNLEARVAEATGKFEKTQRGLMLAERLAATGRLAAGVAHEINNPLGGMINAARSVQKQQSLSPKDREYVDLIVDGLGRIQQIVQSLLRFSRHQQSPVGPVNMADVVDHAVGFCQHRIEAEGVALKRSMPKDLPPVLGAGAELSQVVLNLLTNALDAVKGRPVREIEIEASAGDGRLVTTRVTDTGCGMNEEQRRNACELFYTTKGPDKGTGLGLAIVHHLITSHGGQLEIESEVGKGTCVTFRLPRS